MALMSLLRMEMTGSAFSQLLCSLSVPDNGRIRLIVASNEAMRACGDFIDFYDELSKAGRYTLAVRAGASIRDVDLKGMYVGCFKMIIALDL